MRKRTTYNQLLFDKGINVLRRERIVFSTNGVDIFVCKRMNWTFTLYHIQKIKMDQRPKRKS